MGAWIETRYIINYFDSDSVAPLWVRGLKHAVSVSHDLIRRRTLMGAWIETVGDNRMDHVIRVAPLWVRGLKLVGHCLT